MSENHCVSMKESRVTIILSMMQSLQSPPAGVMKKSFALSYSSHLVECGLFLLQQM